MTMIYKILAASYERVETFPGKPGSERVRYYREPDKENIWVLRIQNEEGYGPYGMSLEDQKKWKDPKQKKGASVPMSMDLDSAVQDMVNDSEDAGGSQFLYGFKDEKQLQKYVSTSELKRLAAMGYNPVWVKANAAWIGKTQVVFEPYWE